MLKIFCGDHTVASRDAFVAYRDRLRTEQTLIIDTEPSQVLELVHNDGSYTHDLFGNAPVYSTSKLIWALRKKYNRKMKDSLRAFAQDDSMHVIDWEEQSAYDLGIDRDKFSFVHESKMSESTFTLLPALVPGNRTTFLKKLDLLTIYQPVEVTYSMIMRHVRLMLLLQGELHPRDNPYLIRIAQQCAKYWSRPQIISFYRHLLSIDINVKTGRNTPLSLRDQLDVLAGIAL